MYTIKQVLHVGYIENRQTLLIYTLFQHDIIDVVLRNGLIVILYLNNPYYVAGGYFPHNSSMSTYEECLTSRLVSQDYPSVIALSNAIPVGMFNLSLIVIEKPPKF